MFHLFEKKKKMLIRFEAYIILLKLRNTAGYFFRVTVFEF